MTSLELLPDEVHLREADAHHIRGKLNSVVCNLTLTNQRFMVPPSLVNLDLLDELRRLLRILTGKSVNGRKPLLEVRLDELTAISRSKFGFNDRILLLETTNGQQHRFGVDDFEAWIEAIREAIDSTNGIRMVEAGTNRWVVQRRVAGSS